VTMSGEQLPVAVESARGPTVPRTLSRLADTRSARGCQFALSLPEPQVLNANSSKAVTAQKAARTIAAIPQLGRRTLAANPSAASLPTQIASSYLHGIDLFPEPTRMVSLMTSHGSRSDHRAHVRIRDHHDARPYHLVTRH
jgi:hypothetical protein